MHISPLSRNTAYPTSYLNNRPQYVRPNFTPPEGRDTYIALNYRCSSLDDMIAFDRAKRDYWHRDTGQLPKLDSVKADVEAMDFSGMSKGEIYGALFDRFAEEFGEDFHCCHATSKDDCEVNQAYYGYLKLYIYGSNEERVIDPTKEYDYFTEYVDPAKADLNAAYCEWKGYSGSKEDIRDAIMQKYNYGNDLTMRETLQMQDELYNAGIITSGELMRLAAPISDVFLFIDDTNINDLDSILDQKLDSNAYYMEQLALNEGHGFAAEYVGFIKDYLTDFCKMKPDDIAKGTGSYSGSGMSVEAFDLSSELSNILEKYPDRASFDFWNALFEQGCRRATAKRDRDLLEAIRQAAHARMQGAITATPAEAAANNGLAQYSEAVYGAERLYSSFYSA